MSCISPAGMEGLQGIFQCLHFHTGYATLLFGQFHKNISGVKSVYGLDLVKRETGESPVRTRRCNKGVLFICTTGKPGRWNKAVILEPEDLPVIW